MPVRKPAHFLVKSEPYKFAYMDLERVGRTLWDGVRNFEARNLLRAMRVGDYLLFYHSNEGKEIAGIAQVAKQAYADPTSEEDWSVVDVEPVVALKVPISLAAIREDKIMREMQILKRNRLSVTHVSEVEFARVLEVSGTKLPKRVRTPATVKGV
jgi:predicted RNA-binding protein with PUA-like domain